MSSTSDSSTTQTIPLQYAVMIYQQTSKPGQWGGGRDTMATNGIWMFTGWLKENFTYSAGAQYDSPFQTVVASGIAPLLSLGGVKAMPPVLTGQLWSGSETPEFTIECDLVAEFDPLLEIRNPIVNLLTLVTPKTDITGQLTLMSPGPYLDPSKVWESLSQLFPAVGKILENEGKSSGDGTMPAAAQNTGLVNPQASAKNLPPTKYGTTTNTSSSATSSPSSNGSTNTQNDYVKNALSNQISISIGKYLYFPSVVITNLTCEFLNQIGPNGWPMQATVGITFKPMFLPTQNDLVTMFGMSGA